MKASKLIANRIAGLCAEPRIFGVSGANIEDVIEEVLAIGLSFVLAKHESGAAAMADASARISGEIATVLATSGGGALNLVPGLAESAASRVPVLALVGQPPTAQIGRGAFQETSGLAGTFDLQSVFRPFAKCCIRVESADELEDALEKAVLAATTNPCGPAVLLIPKDIQCADVTEGRAPTRITGNSHSVAVPPDSTLIGNGVKRVILAGEAVSRMNLAAPLEKLAEIVDAEVCVTIEAKDVFDPDSPRFGGIVGMLGHERSVSVIEAAEEIWVLGSRLGTMDRYAIEDVLQRKRVFFAHTEEPFVSGPQWRRMETDVATLLGFHRNEAPLTTLFQNQNHARKPNGYSQEPLRLDNLAELLNPLAAQRRMNWVLDAGNAAASLATDLRLSRGSRFLIALGMGGMGYSFGAGIGAQFANGLPTIVFAGDGSYFMHGAEIHTAVECKLPILFIIADNRGHAMCTTRQQLFFPESDCALNRFSSDVRIADGLQALFPEMPVEHATTVGQLEDFTRVAHDWSGPSALILEIDHDDRPLFRPFQDHQKKARQLDDDGSGRSGSRTHP